MIGASASTALLILAFQPMNMICHPGVPAAMAFLAILVHRSIGMLLHREQDRGTGDTQIRAGDNPISMRSQNHEPHGEREVRQNPGWPEEEYQSPELASRQDSRTGTLQISFLPSLDKRRFPGEIEDQNIQFQRDLKTVPDLVGETIKEEETDQSTPQFRGAEACAEGEETGSAGGAWRSAEEEVAAEDVNEWNRQRVPNFEGEAAAERQESVQQVLLDEGLLKASRKEVARVQVIFVIRLFAQLILLSIAMTKMPCGHLEFTLSWVILFVLSQTWDIASILHDSKLSKGPQ